MEREEVKRYITTPVELCSTRMGIVVLPVGVNEPVQNAVARSQMIPITTTSKQGVYYDRKLIVTNSGRSYSGFIQAKPTQHDKERRESEKCYAILRYTEQNKASLNFCFQLQTLTEDIESDVLKSGSLKEIFNEEMKKLDRRRRNEQGFGLEGDEEDDEEEKPKKAEKKGRRKGKKKQSQEEEQEDDI